MTKVQKRYVSVKQMYVFNYIFYIFIIERTVWEHLSMTVKAHMTLFDSSIPTAISFFFQFLLQADDLVTILGGLNEIKLFCSLFHK